LENKRIKPEVVLEISIKALEVYDIEPNIIKSMLTNLERILNNNITKEKIIDILKFEAEYVEGQDGTAGQAVWEDYFEDVANEILI
jgi:fructose-1-phosphate kinase PfkB-like protein